MKTFCLIDKKFNLLTSLAFPKFPVSSFSGILLKVEFATDVEAFLPQANEVQTYETISDDFGQDSSVVYLYLTSISNSNILSMENLVDILESN